MPRLQYIRTLTQSEQVCVRLEALVKQTPSLQCPVLLAASGIRDNTKNPLPTVEKLSRLEHYLEAWRSLRWTQHHVKIVLQSTYRRRSAFTPEGFLTTCTEQDDLTSWNVQFWQIPSRLRGMEEQLWDASPLPRGAVSNDPRRDMDPSQDLWTRVRVETLS